MMAPLIEPRSQPPPRDHQTLLLQIKVLERALRIRDFSTEDAAGFASKAGRYEVIRPHRCDGVARPWEGVPRGQPQCTEKVCYCPSVERQPFVGAIVRFVDAQCKDVPRFVFQRLPGLLRALSSREQMVLYLSYRYLGKDGRQGLSYRQIIDWRGPFGLNGLGLKSPTRVGEIRHGALEKLARMLWTDQGEPIWD
jgi:hypothetical protein